MAKIQVLKDELISQIAAGEIVERPASVVKELIDNAIDAGATQISVEIKEGGQRLIEVADNGCGMAREDAILAFIPHATSKLRSIQDLEKVATLGFRGEALPTIASVSRVELITKSPDEELATKILVEGGNFSGAEDFSFPEGTRIQVKNLFYNVPARRKFLKSVGSETAAISDIVCHYMMAYPEIAFKFTKNNNHIATSPGSGNLMDAIVVVHGEETAASLLQLKPLPSSRGITVTGYISPPNRPKPAQRYVTAIVNRRVVSSKLIMQAVRKATAAFFPVGKYPVLIMDIRLDPEMLDVNVHPQKTEVKFKDERQIFSAIWQVVQSTLSGLKILEAPEPQNFASFNPSENEDDEPARAYSLSQPGGGHQTLFTPPPSEYRDFSFSNTQQTQTISRGTEVLYNVGDTDSEAFHTGARAAAGTASLEPVTALSNPVLLAQLKNTYLLGEDDNGLFIVDQHVAHERVLFDQLVETYKDMPVTPQPLLFPIHLKLLPSERMIVSEHLQELKDLGFTIQQEEDMQYYAVSVPSASKKTSDTANIQNVLSGILDGWEGRSFEETKTDLLKMMACKAAVKAGDSLTPPEWNSLLLQLLSTQNPFTCPHGRPIVLRLPTKNIEAAFLRI
ncbi:MAG: DNA mismatch repair endonuclease MutL [Candidatus Riflebacteria bacterium]|nr:DNA mismatch repair endonuclease MutL [Candidatus Riflebacteria bacterium]